MVRLPQVALPLGRLLGEDVALVGVAALVLAGSGLPEALGRRPIGLDLGHWCVLAKSMTGLGGGSCHAFRPARAGGRPLIRKESAAGPEGATESRLNRAGYYALPAKPAQTSLLPACGEKVPREGRMRGVFFRGPDKKRAPHPCPLPASGERGTRDRRAARGDYFFFGAIIMTIWRPSRRGRDSITMSSPRSASIRWAI